MKSIRLSICFLIFFCIAASAQTLIPKPTSIVLSKSPGFSIDGNTAIIANTVGNFEAVKIFNEFYKKRFGNTLNALLNPPARTNAIYVKTTKKNIDSSEAYSLKVYKDSIVIEGSAIGCFHGLMTLVQLIEKQLSGAYVIKSMVISDKPAFTWRGMHLDVSRHFFSVEFIKKYIDLIAFYKMNTFHWHLTDDQGWRIEIKKYPKLTEEGAWRSKTLKGHSCESPNVFDSTRYGGFYTQEEVKEVVEYARQRYITIIPEIELPGHAQAAIASYPYLSCTGLPISVASKWGIFDDVFCTHEGVFTFLEDVLTEVMDLFPSKIIHIGGDECPKIQWKTCLRCQAVMKNQGLKNEHELQSYFIKRIEKFVNSKGKVIMGWDEILDGGLAPNAMVMSWRGVEGGIAAANQNHKVVMTPTEWCYFDHYQGDAKFEPLAIGWYTPLEVVYSFDPVPAELNDTLRKYILGSQGNIWTEYLATPEQVEYMALPRMSALAEVLWTYPSIRNYTEFSKRLVTHLPLLKQMGYNFSNAFTATQMHVDSTKDYNGIQVSLTQPDSACAILYTIDGSPPSPISLLYTRPILITATTTLKAQAYKQNKPVGALLEYKFLVNKATGKKITVKYAPNEEFSYGGVFSLVNGITAKGYSYEPCWIGFAKDNLEAIIDLGKLTEVNRVSLSTENADLGWITSPKSMQVFISNDGIRYSLEAFMDGQEIKSLGRYLQVFTGGVKTRYVKIVLENYGVIPEGLHGAGDESWLFVDELTIE